MMLNDLDMDFLQLFWADDGVLGFTNRESYLKGYIEGVIGRWSLKFGQCALIQTPNGGSEMSQPMSSEIPGVHSV
jgi:hypothetical protein